MAHLLRLRSLIAVQWPGLSALVPQWWPAMLYSVKNALAALMALGISLSVGLPMPFWAMTTVFIVANPVSAATRSKAIYRGLGTMIGAAVAVALVPLLVEAPLLLSLALALWVGGCLALSLLDRSPRAYVLMLAGYTATIIGFPSVAQPEAVFDVAAARVTEILLVIACATVVHSLIMPDSLGGRLGPRLEAWLGDAEKWLHDILAGGSGLATVAVDRDRRRLAVDALDCQLLASHVPYDTSHWREANRTVQALLYRMLLLLPILSGLADRRRGLGDDRGLQPALATARTWLEQGADPARQPDLLANVGLAHTWPDLLRESFLVRLRQASTVLGEARQLMSRLDDPVMPLPPKLDGERVQLRLTSDPGLALLSGASASLAILLVCAFWIFSGWPDGAGAAVLTGVFCCLFAAMDNPVPMILSFGAAIMAGVPLAGVWLFGILPGVDGFVPLCLVLLPLMLLAGSGGRYGPRTALASRINRHRWRCHLLYPASARDPVWLESAGVWRQKARRCGCCEHPAIRPPISAWPHANWLRSNCADRKTGLRFRVPGPDPRHADLRPGAKMPLTRGRD